MDRLRKLGFLTPLFSRLLIAAVFIHSGWGKLTHLDKAIAFFSSLGIPAPQLQAPFASATEFFCGTLILLGLLTRYASIPLIGVMLVAIRTAKWEDVDGWVSLVNMSEFIYIVILAGLVFSGAGALSLDQLLFKSRK